MGCLGRAEEHSLPREDMMVFEHLRMTTEATENSQGVGG